MQTKVEYCDDGKTLKLDRSKPYGTVYADGYSEARYVQGGKEYRGDGTPLSYKSKESPDGGSART